MKNTLLKIGIVLMLITIICTGYVQAADTDGYTFGISSERKYKWKDENEQEHEDKYIYTFQSTEDLKYIWNVQQYNNEIPDTNNIFYCLAQGYGDFSNFNATAIDGQRPNAAGGISASSYSGPYKLKDPGAINTLTSTFYDNNSKVLAFNEDRINGLIWILDNMYIPVKDDLTTIDENENTMERIKFLNKVPCKDDEGNIEGIEEFMKEQKEACTVSNVMKRIKGEQDDLIDNDIEIAQQLAIWQITDGIGPKGMPKIYLSKEGEALTTYKKIFSQSAYIIVNDEDERDINKTSGEMREYYIKMIYNYLVEGAQEAQKDAYKGDNTTTISVYANAAAQPVVTITREKELVGKYNVKIKKVNTKGEILPGATFTVDGKDYITGADGIAEIASNVEITKDNVNDEDLYTIVEETAPNGYTKYNGTITLGITKKEAEDGLSYTINNATLDDTSNASGKVTIQKDDDTSTITITVVDEEITGQYNVKVKKVDTKGNVLPGATFTVNGREYITGSDGIAEVASNVEITKANVENEDTYEIIETTAPKGYIKYNGTITLKVKKCISQDGLNYIIDTENTSGETTGEPTYVSMNKNTNTITITVKDEKELTNISGTKTWEDYNNKDNTRPESITVNLLKNGTKIDSKIVTPDSEGNWKYTFENLEKYDEAGNEYIYTITEDEVNDYETDINGYNITNTYTTSKKVQGTKTWVDYNNKDNTRPESITVNLLKNGTKIDSKTVTPDSEGNWKYTFENLEKYDETGNEYIYTITEEVVNNYETNINGYDITNTYTTSTKVEGTKTWEDYDNKDNTRPESITVNLLKNGTKIDSKIVTPDSEGNWKYTFESLEKYDEAGNEYIYTITEEKVNNYETTINGYNITNTYKEGQYTVKINKQNQQGVVLQDAIFTVDGKNYTTDSNGYATIASNITINSENVNNTDTYNITEIKAPEGYVVYDGTIELKVTKKLSDDGEQYEINQVTLDEKSTASGKVRIEINGNTITVIVIEDNIDLALRKFISKVVDSEGRTVYSEKELESRIPEVNTTKLKNTTSTTADYNHSKEPVKVSVGDKVTYTLRVYNEGQSDAYIKQITDYLPKYLKYVDNGEWLRTYSESEEDKYESKATTSPVTIITGSSENLSELVGKEMQYGVLLPAYNRQTNKISYIDVQIICEVLSPEINEENDINNEDNLNEEPDISSEEMPHEEDENNKYYKITNIAEITKMLDRTQKEVNKDIDSSPKNVGLPENEQQWQEYKDEEIGKKDYIQGQQDDDDFEKLIILIPKYDLSLRKFITEVDDTKLVNVKGKYIREPLVYTASLKEGIEQNGYGTATYIHPKTPVEVKRGNIVTYVIRVYNEGNMDAYVSEITDNLPQYLEFIEEDELNKKYGWKYDKNSRVIKTNITAKSSKDETGIYTKRENGKLLSAYAGGDTLDYIDVQIRCRVSNKVDANSIQTNIAEITEFTDTREQKVNDKDSVPNGNLEIPGDDKLPNYKDEISNNPFVPGQEDDDDFEKVIIEGDFDLALRKFITKVNTIDVNNRYPSLSKDTNGNIKYTHTKTPLEVCTGDTVIYTIRVYNEGEIAGYANEITDNVPYGLEFIKNNEINKEYRWKMLDENEKETEDISKAKYLVTDYLSEDQEKETGRNNLIKPLDKKADLSNKNPDYRDVQIAFKVTYEVKQVGEESRILVNVAQISKDSDDDIDSTPNRNEEYDENNHEDDIDYENVKVKYFDLSLLKWVTKAIVVENGETKITESGHTGYENPEPDLKVEIKSKDVNKVIVKFAYTIKITNEGQIEGYAKEITDYIPEGLEFKQEDNPDWYVREDGKVATELLENVLLQPGESAEVEIILTWINGEKNLGRKVNVAEISKDDNPSKTPDIDSTPDNQVPGEDDIDDAPVLLVIKTGGGIVVQYIVLIITVITILGTGTIAIRKFVL